MSKPKLTQSCRAEEEEVEEDLRGFQNSERARAVMVNIVLLFLRHQQQLYELLPLPLPDGCTLHEAVKLTYASVGIAALCFHDDAIMIS